MRKRMKLDKIRHINLVYLLDFQKLPDSEKKKKIRFSYKYRQNKFGGNGLLDLLILNLKVLH